MSSSELERSYRFEIPKTLYSDLVGISEKLHLKPNSIGKRALRTGTLIASVQKDSDEVFIKDADGEHQVNLFGQKWYYRYLNRAKHPFSLTRNLERWGIDIPRSSVTRTLRCSEGYATMLNSIAYSHNRSVPSLVREFLFILRDLEVAEFDPDSQIYITEGSELYKLSMLGTTSSNRKKNPV